MVLHNAGALFFSAVFCKAKVDNPQASNMFSYLQVTSLVLLVVALAAGSPQRSLSPTQPQSQATTGTEGDFNLLPAGTRLSQVTKEQLDKFFNNEQSVTTLTQCLLKPRSCTSETGRNLVRQVSALKNKGQCADCSQEEQSRLNEIIYYFVKNYRDRYPELWDMALPRVIHIVAGIANQ
ncbi:Insect odorant-binding protein A10/Ejaculatory bulb-specific protein 3 [Trinorchestia longiramus]|nr:Insect odorant-binding protein A10/Ejaculatory bulb-specific protein 3 [Trinorchestia longiramus]